MNGYRRP